jgi:phage gp36-like protein
MSDQLEGAKPLTALELLDAALGREIASDETRKPEALVDAFSTLVGSWLLTHSETPEMDAVTLLCKARGYISRYKLEAALHRILPSECTQMGGD